MVAEEDGGKHKCVLYPLQRAKELDVMLHLFFIGANLQLLFELPKYAIQKVDLIRISDGYFTISGPYSSASGGYCSISGYYLIGNHAKPHTSSHTP